MAEEKIPVLETKSLGIQFGGLKAVNDVNIEIYKGELIGLIGPNGAGKTTIFNLITGIYTPTTGSYILCGRRMNGLKTHQVVEAGIGGFGNMRALSTRNDDPKTASRPFDKDRDGFVLGEGSATLILEELEHAKARGAKIYAEITGTGLSADAYHITASHPEGLGTISVMRQAVEESGMALTDVDHINTHGTSTPIGDISEPKAIVGLFGDHSYKMAINSTKSMTGHLLGAAGAVEAIATILTIKNGIVPPTINHFTDDPQIPALDFTFNQAKRREVNFAISNAFGFGGHNVCLAFRKY